jgi:hypothetical protein
VSAAISRVSNAISLTVVVISGASGVVLASCNVVSSVLTVKNTNTG